MNHSHAHATDSEFCGDCASGDFFADQNARDWAVIAAWEKEVPTMPVSNACYGATAIRDEVVTLPGMTVVSFGDDDGSVGRCATCGHLADGKRGDDDVIVLYPHFI